MHTWQLLSVDEWWNWLSRDAAMMAHSRLLRTTNCLLLQNQMAVQFDWRVTFLKCSVARGGSKLITPDPDRMKTKTVIIAILVWINSPSTGVLAGIYEHLNVYQLNPFQETIAQLMDRKIDRKVIHKGYLQSIYIYVNNPMSQSNMKCHTSDRENIFILLQ